MKYPIGTKCWVARTDNDHRQYRGTMVTITGHGVIEVFALGMKCRGCESGDHMVETDAGPAGCCFCNLIPVDDPDAGKAVEEDLALPIDPRKIGEIA